MDTVNSLLILMVVVQLLYIINIIVYINSMATVYTCKYCWQQYKSGDVIMRSTLGGAVQIFQWSVCFSVESTLLIK